MKQEIKRDYKEIAKKNTFIAHAAEIREISKVNNVDVGVAADMYIANHNLTRTPELMEQQKEFTALCRENPLKNIVEELAKYNKTRI